ncbi:MAG: class I SAM-dependent methyltransferase [Acutalibacteraceae bacterium]
MNKTSITALMSAFGRAYHTQNAENPIFADTKVRELITDEEYNMIANYIISGIDFFAPDKKDSFENSSESLKYLVNTQIAPTPLARAAFCENALKASAQTGTEQYVILGAGLDTFAFREQEFLKKYEVFELDHPLTQQDKKERIKRAGWTLPDKLHFVAIDFTKDDIGEKLVEAGFSDEKKTFFSWLGVSMYLEQSAIEKMLEKLSALAADGSELIFDYADDGLFRAEERRVQNMLAMAKAGGEEMKSCFNQKSLELMLSAHHFFTKEHLSRREIQNRFFSNRNDCLSAFEHINYEHAVLKK